jgi:hypothetical protein
MRVKPFPDGKGLTCEDCFPSINGNLERDVVNFISPAGFQLRRCPAMCISHMFIFVQKPGIVQNPAPGEAGK